MGSAEPLKGEKEGIEFSYDPSIPLSAYNTITGQFTEATLDPNEVKFIHIGTADRFMHPAKKEDDNVS